MNQTITIRQGNKTYTVSVADLGELGFECMRCVLDGYEFVPVVDGDIVKHGINHLRFMLL